MLYSIIKYSLRNKFFILFLVATLVGVGTYAIMHIPIGAVPDVTNNQVQVITTSRNLPAEDVERYLTYPVELEMANLPGVVEIRSISKFGLSVVTIVFEESMGTYLPRQLIAEKLKSVEDKIPEGFGKPFMGPISTGLGEIYQYVLDIKPGYESKYDAMDLRTIQDWVVKRQLSGIPGVVEVNTWGGFLKTFEVAIDPGKLRALDISIDQVYQAISDNNSVAGGGYIEKANEAYFIRAEGKVKSLDELNGIMVAKKGGSPIFIKDIGEARFGYATRFGAITGNGQGEKVLGQVMMLKGADSKRVIDAVIARVAEVQKTLPEGVYINPFLERSELIKKTTHTVGENLIFGFLIVLFVVIFLLGNWRSGIVVASVIPLTLLFAISMMYLFGIDANLMSLGAIDFGIIIDGAVIIVEYVTFILTKHQMELMQSPQEARSALKDNFVSQGTNKMLHSAIFGQIIIIIVFIPILTMTGVEGKMFIPMALAFCFALVGAMFLCFTYVPVMSALFIVPVKNGDNALSSKLINYLKRIYEPSLHLALRFKSLLLGISVMVLVLMGWLFSTMGAEFVPTLDEGDFVIQPVLKTGMSLSATVNMTGRIETILKQFPEVDQVVSRIGAAEVPTDPMSMEESDVIIKLFPKKTWTTARTKDGLADAFKEAILHEIPGIEIEFTQPIEMRFNELISGARSDLVVKVFGDDLNILFEKAQEIEQKIKGVAGAADIVVEKIEGLPQLVISYDRQKIAKYGVSINDLNQVLAMGFAGLKAGEIYDKEAQFDVTLRFDSNARSSIKDLENSLITTADGMQLPLSEFASIIETTGPAKISRDDTKRRVVIGVNVRNRDLKSVVQDIQKIVSNDVEFETGYYAEYGGQFKNLEQASRRLMIAVPIALFLIYLLLYLAFNSFRDASVIFSAIPLASIGGVLALYVRGMPFSISAGVGFIALFGIAVLNGIVLVEHFKELKSKTMGLNELIVRGASDRLRPVLLTAIAAALGFLPMAISTSAGAEVQKPLATVVIGGLITSTMLTLIILPVLYSIFGSITRLKKEKVIALLIFLCAMPLMQFAQKPVDLDIALKLAQANNPIHRTNALRIQMHESMIPAAKEIGKTNFFYGYDKNNIAPNNYALHVLGISHGFKSPGVNKTSMELQKSLLDRTIVESKLMANQLEGDLSIAFDKIVYYQSLHRKYQDIKQNTEELLLKGQRKLELGGGNALEVLALTRKKNEWHMELQDLDQKLRDSYVELERIILYGEPFVVQDSVYVKLEHTRSTRQNLVDDFWEKEVEGKKLTSNKNWMNSKPELFLTAFNGMNTFGNAGFYPGVEVGISVPLSTSQYKARRKSDEFESEIAAIHKEATARDITSFYKSQDVKLQALQDRLKWFEENQESTFEKLKAAADKGLQNGEIDVLMYLMLMDEIQLGEIQKLELVHEYNVALLSKFYLRY